VFLDATVVNVALPAIGRDLRSPAIGVLEGQAYVYSAYLLTLSALLILAGGLADFHGRRRMFLVGLGGFGATSVLCGLAPSLELLIAFRLLQGASGALLVPGSLAIITATFSGEERGRTFGLWAGASAAVTIIGPWVGGTLVELLSWRVIFLVNVPVLALAGWATWAGVAESRDGSRGGHFDWPGALLMTIAIAGLVFGPIHGQQRDWQAPLAFAALAVGAAAALAFPVLMARSPQPLVPLELFRSRNFSVTNLSTLLIYGALYLVGYYLPIYTQGALGYSAAAAGAALVPGFLLLALFSSVAGTAAARRGPRRFMAVGPILMGLGVLWFARIPLDSAPLRLDVGSGIEWLALAAAGLAGFRLALFLHGALPRAIGAAAAVVVAGSGVAGALGAPGTTSYARDLLPGLIVYGAGVAVMVAPLTTALMASVPVARSGIASAINNAVSRVGPQLAGSVIFVAITAAFYASLAARAPGLDVGDATVRATYAPLNRPVGDVPDELLRAAALASTDAFHLAMVLAAALLVAGAAVNGVGIRDPSAAARAVDRSGPGAAPVGGVLVPDEVDEP
jgi:EmrB/QacA subfamily drug resistance transporter